jgi:preprotein translocase subunit SecF
MAAGAYSSIFIATPLVVQLKELEPGIRTGDARALRHRERREADRYAAVPAFADDMPVPDTADELADLDDDEREPESTGATRAPVRTPRSTAGERPASRAVSPSASAKRAQPSRKPRSRRGKR